LADYAQSVSLDSEIDYWRTLARSEICHLPVDFPDGENTAASARTVVATLDVEETRGLLQDVPKFYRSQINDALLTALVRAVVPWTGNGSLLIDLEGNGRETLIEDADLSRTIGWFTAVVPVRLELRDGNNPGDALRSVKEQLRALPNRGIGFGLLRYLHRDAAWRAAMREIPSPEIAFNYMGQYGPRFESSHSKRLAELMGPSLSPRALRSHLFELDASVAEGRLEVAWTYSENVHRRSTVEDLARRFVEELGLLIANCSLPDAGGYTPSDFARARLSQGDLDRLISRLH
jgi:non-ribosomal peptide synthase protein (TIGR01720 family)